MTVGMTGGSWAQATEVEQPSNLAGEPNGPNGWLESLSCLSAETCTAVGWYRDSAEHFEAMATEETKGVWTRASEIELPFEASQALRLAPGLRSEGIYYGNLNVACTTAGSCSAAGFSDNHPPFPPEEYEGLLATKADGHWSAAEVAGLPGDAATSSQEALIYQLACAASGTCTAGGGYTTEEGHEPMTVAESGGAWQQASKLALPGNAEAKEQYASIESIACPSAGSCIAAGYYKESEGQYQAMIASQSAGTWEAAQEVTLPPTAAANPQEAWLSSISCATATSCSSVGVFETGAPAFQLMGLNAAATLSVSTASLPAAEVGKPYEAKLSASGGAGADTWSVASGSLPARLTLNQSTGVISGTPTSESASSFAVMVSNAGPPAQSATAALSIVVAAAPPSIVLPPKQPAKPRIIIASSKLSERKGEAKVKLICKRAACKGTMKLFDVVAKKVEQKAKGRAKGKAKARIEHIRVLLGSGHYSIGEDKTETVALKLTAKAKKLLAKDAVRKHAKPVHAKPIHAKPVRAKLEVRLLGGKSQTRNVVLVAAHHNKQRGHKHRTHKH